MISFFFLCIIFLIKHVSPEDLHFKDFPNIFEIKKNKAKIMKHINLVKNIFVEAEKNLEDLKLSYNDFLIAKKSSDKTKEYIVSMVNEKTNKFLKKMNNLQVKYLYFKNNIEDIINKKTEIFYKSIQNMIIKLFHDSPKELNQIDKFIKYINLNSQNSTLIIDKIFSKALRINDIYEQNINKIFKLSKKYYKIKLKTLKDFIFSEYNKYKEHLKLISNENYLNNLSDILYIELLKDYLLNSMEKVTMIDISNYFKNYSFLDLSYFFSTFFKNYNKIFIVYVINRLPLNSYNKKMVLLDSNKLLDILNFIKKNYNHLKIDYVVINIFNVYMSVFISSNEILHYVSYEDSLSLESLIIYNVHNYGFYFTNQKIDYNKFNSDKDEDNLFVLYLRDLNIENNFFIYNREDMIKFKKENVIKILENKQLGSKDLFLNMYLLKLETEYNFYKQFSNINHRYISKFSVYDSNITLAYDSLSKFNVPHQIFTPHFRDIYILFIIHPSIYINRLCSILTYFLIKESILALTMEKSNIIDIYFHVDKFTLIVNNKSLTYDLYFERSNLNDQKFSINTVRDCIRSKLHQNYSDYLDYLEVIFFIAFE